MRGRRPCYAFSGFVTFIQLFCFEYEWMGTLGFDTIDNTLVFAFVQDIFASIIKRVLNPTNAYRRQALWQVITAGEKCKLERKCGSLGDPEGGSQRYTSA